MSDPDNGIIGMLTKYAVGTKLGNLANMKGDRIKVYCKLIRLENYVERTKIPFNRKKLKVFHLGRKKYRIHIQHGEF